MVIEEALCLSIRLSVSQYIYIYIYIYSIIAAFVSLRSIIMVELMGLERLTNAFGLVTMCQGFSSLIGAPIAGNYTTSGVMREFSYKT